MTEIQAGIGDLIARLKQDGVEAGSAEKQRLLDEAKKEARAIVDDAKKDAERIKADAEKAAENRARQHDAELRLAARDFVAAFHQRLTKEITGPLIAAEVSGAVKDEGFLKDALQSLVVDWVNGGGKGVDVVVGSEKKAALESFFKAALKSAADDGRIVVSDEAGLEGFRLTREGEGFVWDVSQEAVAAELARLVDPSLRQLLLPEV